MNEIEIEKINEICLKSNSYNEILFRLKYHEKKDVEINKNNYWKLQRIIKKYNMQINHMRYYGINFRSQIWWIPNENFLEIVNESDSFGEIKKK